MGDDIQLNGWHISASAAALPAGAGQPAPDDQVEQNDEQVCYVHSG